MNWLEGLTLAEWSCFGISRPLFTLAVVSWEESWGAMGALWGLSPFTPFPWLPLQGPPGMRGSPGPPGPIVSICDFLPHLRRSQRGHNAHTPFCCLVSMKLGRAETGDFHLPTPFPHQSICRDCGLWPLSPLGLACSTLPCLWSCLGEPSRVHPCLCIPISVVFCTLDSGCPRQEGLGSWLMVSAAKKVVATWSDLFTPP